jgi:hypothetical protein
VADVGNTLVKRDANGQFFTQQLVIDGNHLTTGSPSPSPAGTSGGFGGLVVGSSVVQSGLTDPAASWPVSAQFGTGTGPYLCVVNGSLYISPAGTDTNASLIGNMKGTQLAGKTGPTDPNGNIHFSANSSPNGWTDDIMVINSQAFTSAAGVSFNYATVHTGVDVRLYSTSHVVNTGQGGAPALSNVNTGIANPTFNLVWSGDTAGSIQFNTTGTPPAAGQRLFTFTLIKAFGQGAVPHVQGLTRSLYNGGYSLDAVGTGAFDVYCDAAMPISTNNIRIGYHVFGVTG